MSAKIFLAGKASGIGGHVIAVFDDRDKAATWAQSASAWYGRDHPLYPVTVMGDALLNPSPFPVPPKDDSDEEIRRIFDTLDED